MRDKPHSRCRRAIDVRVWLDSSIVPWSINVHVSGMSDAKSSGQAWSKKRCVLSAFNFSNASAKRHQFYLHATRGENVFAGMGLPYARENIINQTTTATSRAAQSLTKKSLLTAPYYHSLSCDMNIIDESSLNVVFSPGILYCAFEKSRDLERGKMEYHPHFPSLSFLLTQIFLFIYTRYSAIESFFFFLRGHILHWKKIIWELIWHEKFSPLYSFRNMCALVYVRHNFA